jgi:Amt family ammonium transporter
MNSKSVTVLLTGFVISFLTNTPSLLHAQIELIPENVREKMKAVDDSMMPPMKYQGEAGVPDPTLLDFASSSFNSGNVGLVLLGMLANLFLLTPGLLLFYCGLFRTQNLSTLFQRYLLLAVILSMAWSLWIFSLAFARNLKSLDVAPGEVVSLKDDNYRGNAFIGSFKHAFLRGLDPQIGAGIARYPVRRPKETVPHMLFMAFHMMLFISAPAPLVASLGHRIRPSQMIVLMVVWGTLVYAPVAYWIWGGGWLTKTFDGGGGNLVHVTVGVTALALTLWLKRPSEAAGAEDGDDKTLLILGTALYWCGSILSNSARSMAADGAAVNSAVTTHLAACAGLLGWCGTDWLVRGKTDLRSICAGAISGLIAISAALRYVPPQSALVIGLCGGFVNFVVYSFVRRRLAQNELLVVAAVHSTAGVLSVLLAGVFATAACGGFDQQGNPISGLIGGNPGQLIHQVVAASCTILLAFVGTMVACTAIRLTLGLSNQPHEPEPSDVKVQ